MALLMRDQRYEMVFQLYSQAMAQARELEECQRTFQDHYREFVAQGSAYAAYAGPVMECYYERLRRFDRKASRAAVVELFQTLADSGSGAPFGERLVQELACEIPFAGPSRENERFIQTAYTYLHRMGRPIEGRLSLLLAGMVLEACGKPGQIGEAKDTLCQMLQGRRGRPGGAFPEGGRGVFQLGAAPRLLYVREWPEYTGLVWAVPHACGGGAPVLFPVRPDFFKAGPERPGQSGLPHVLCVSQLGFSAGNPSGAAKRGQGSGPVEQAEIG